MTGEAFIEELRSDCGYHPEQGGAVDDLIAYKDALEEYVWTAIDLIEAEIERTYFQRIEHQLGYDREEWEAMTDEEQTDKWEAFFESWGWEDECNYDAVEGEIGGLRFALRALRGEREEVTQ
jgi:hypothetical protein